MLESKSIEVNSYCTFSLNKRRFAISVLLVKEVHAPTAITPIPDAPPAIRGYVNLRGNLHVVIDPRPWLTSSADLDDGDGFLIVFKPHVGEAFAIQVDSLGDILRIGSDHIDIPQVESDYLADSAWQSGLILGYAKLEDTIVTLVDPSELFRLCWTDL